MLDLPEEAYQIAYKSMHNSVMYSTRVAFSQNKFFRTLTPRLKQKFVQAVLGDIINRISFFFSDLNDMNACSNIFI